MTQLHDTGATPPRLLSGTATGDAPRVLEALRRDATADFGGVLAGFWGVVEEQVRITSLAGHDYNASRDDRAALLIISQRAQVLATQFRDTIALEFEHWLHGTLPAAARGHGLTLMSEPELEMQLCGDQAIERLEHRFQPALEAIDGRLRRLAAALGLQGRPLNPVRPAVAVSAFIKLFGPSDLTPGLRGLAFSLLEKRLVVVAGELYAKLDARLAGAGFGRDTVPVGAAIAQGAGRVAAPAGHWVPDGGTVEHQAPAAPLRAPARGAPPNDGRAQGATGDGRPPRYRDVVREQLRTWRAGSGARPQQWQSGDGGGVDAPGGQDFRLLGTEELLHVASLLQGDDPAPYAHALAGQRPLAAVIRDEILGGVRQMGLDPAQTRFSIDEEDAIDLVGILFQSLFEANDLLSRAQAMYGRLVVPYLKVALTDDSLFNRRSHPARQLIDALTEACDGNAGDTPQDQETLERAERAVDRVVAEYQADQAIFELAAAELRDQLDQQRRRSELAERRAAEAIHGRERLLQARQDADALVASRLADRPLTTPVVRFLEEQWRHYLVQTSLRDGSGSPRHRAAIGLGDAMLQVDGDAARARGGAVADQLLALQVPLGECYGVCGLDAAAARDAMARIISALALPDTARRVHTADTAAREQLELDEPPRGLQLVAGTGTLDFDPVIAARMRRLRVGQGLRLVDADGHESAARIAWISPLTSRFLIVNRRGIRRLVASPEELAAMVANGQAVVRSVDAPFDEAMKQLWQHLNNAQAQNDGDGASRAAAS